MPERTAQVQVGACGAGDDPRAPRRSPPDRAARPPSLPHRRSPGRRSEPLTASIADLRRGGEEQERVQLRADDLGTYEPVCVRRDGAPGREPLGDEGDRESGDVGHHVHPVGEQGERAERDTPRRPGPRGMRRWPRGPSRGRDAARTGPPAHAAGVVALVVMTVASTRRSPDWAVAGCGRGIPGNRRAPDREPGRFARRLPTNDRPSEGDHSHATTRRLATVVLTVDGAVLLAAGPRSLHVEPDPSRVKPGKMATVEFTPEHGCGDARDERCSSASRRVPANVKPRARRMDEQREGRTMTFSEGQGPVGGQRLRDHLHRADAKTVLVLEGHPAVRGGRRALDRRAGG